MKIQTKIKKRYTFIVAGILAMITLVTAIGYAIYNYTNKTRAYLNGFDAGNIMSDFVMSNKNTMSEADINNFLHSKNPCNHAYDNTVKHYEGKGYQYTIRNNKVVCMADENFGGESAAHIIWQAAQDYNINPQVLIVLLQKEQGLVTDTYPNHKQYAKATGFACPDNGNGCDPINSGFKNQVRKAAKLFSDVLSGGWSNYPAYSTQFVQYSPDRACGGANIYIQNRATSALYRYTPYVPNQAALNTGFGKGDGCSAYGNRNFYNYFTDWFGNTQVSVQSNIDIPDGVYFIRPKAAKNKSIDLDAGSQNNGAKIQLWDTINSSNGQRYRFTRDNDGFYTISSLASNKPISIQGALREGAKIVQTGNSNQCSSKWAIILREGSYRLASPCNGMVIDIPGGNIVNNSQLHIWSNNNTEAQKWSIVKADSSPIEQGLYTIRNTQSDKVIDVSNGDRNNGGRLQIWSENTNINTQKFELVLGDDGLYTIKNINSGNVVDLSNGITANGTRIQTWNHNSSTCAQKWNIEPRSNDSYSIKSSCSRNFAIDIDGGQINRNGAALHLWSNGTQTSQSFRFTKTQPIINTGRYTITNVTNTSKGIDVNGGSRSEGEYLHLWDKINNLDSQQYNFYLEGNGYYSIQNVRSWLFMDIQNKSLNNGTRIVQKLGDGSLTQKWELARQYDGSFIIYNAKAHRAIDLSNNELANGRKIQLWDNNMTSAQRWRIESI